MKKIKEFVKKIGNKKRCLLSLLLAGLLMFAIVSGLNGSKSTKTEVYAISAPTTKNLDLNGVKYTYQTTLSELKNNYNLFTNWSYVNFSIKEDSEGVTELFIGFMQDEDAYNDSQWIETQNIIKNAISIEYDDILIESIISTNENKNTKESVFEFENAPLQTQITGIKINYNNLLEIPLLSSSTVTENLDYINVIYLNDFNPNDVIVYTYVNYIKSQEIYYKFKKINGYSVMGVLGCQNATLDEGNEKNSLYGSIPSDNFHESTVQTCVTDGYYFINELEFYSNYFTFKQTNINDNSVTYVPYQGYLLLSESKCDEQFINQILSNSNNHGIVNLNGASYFGGDFESYKPIGTLQFNRKGSGNSTLSFFVGVDTPKQNGITYNRKLGGGIYINYLEQSRLLFISKPSNLNGKINNDNYAGLSAQIDDVLYNVNYIGTPEEEFNEKVEDDFTDLLKTTGIGAVIGLLVGFLVGNPIGGLVVGAVIGLSVAIIPLIIDGLQAIFGYDFLSGLYDFFNAITEFFVNIIDKIVGFLLSIITNPFVLVLIVLVAILYIFVIRPKIK